MPVHRKHVASYGLAFFDERAEHFQRCSFQCARTCCQDVTDVSVFPAEVVDAKTSLEESPVLLIYFVLELSNLLLDSGDGHLH